MTPVTVYTTGPSCQQCTATKRHLDRLSLPYTEVPIDHSDEQMMAAFDELGHTAAPIVCAGEEHWSGYRPDRIDELKSLSRGAV